MIEVTEKNNEINYPCLMKSDHGNVVLFTSETVGMVISGKTSRVGTYTEDWMPGSFKLYTGTLTLTNKL